MKSKKVIKCAINRVHVGYLTPPDKEGARWTGRCDNGMTAAADTAEECADKLAGVM